MRIEQFFLEGLAHSSYLVAGEETCAVVDPRRDVGIYLAAAERLGLKITHVLETHLHADFVSGHLDLAAATGARIIAPASARCDFAHQAVSGGDEIRFENMLLQVVETPGHTPEHVSYLLSDLSRGAEPVAVFCGDTLFIGDVGRPDLFPGRAEELASRLYDSLHEKLLSLPDGCLVCPAHGAGSLCGRSIGSMRLGTIGYERRHNPALAFDRREEFIRSLVVGMPPAPDHFSRCSEINARGPALLSSLAPPASLGPDDFAQKTRRGALVLDTRPYTAFCGGHLPGSLFIGAGGNFSTYAGWILPPDRDIMLVTGEETDPARMTTLLARVGLDRVTGHLDGGFEEWARAGLPVARISLLSSPELDRRLRGGEPFQLVDVRSPVEFSAGHIDGAVNIPAPDLREPPGMLDPKAETVLVCSSGQRSTMAASLLSGRGYRRLFSLAGGLGGFSAAGFNRRCAVCSLPHGPQVRR